MGVMLELSNVPLISSVIWEIYNKSMNNNVIKL